MIPCSLNALIAKAVLIPGTEQSGIELGGREMSSVGWEIHKGCIHLSPVILASPKLDGIDRDLQQVWRMDLAARNDNCNLCQVFLLLCLEIMARGLKTLFPYATVPGMVPEIGSLVIFHM